MQRSCAKYAKAGRNTDMRIAGGWYTTSAHGKWHVTVLRLYETQQNFCTLPDSGEVERDSINTHVIHM